MVCKIVPRNRLVLDIVSVCFYAIEDIEAVVCEKQEWPCCTYRAFVQIFVFYAGQDGIRYYQRMVTNKLDQRLGAENPFEHIWTRGGAMFHIRSFAEFPTGWRCCFHSWHHLRCLPWYDAEARHPARKR